MGILNNFSEQYLRIIFGLFALFIVTCITFFSTLLIWKLIALLVSSYAFIEWLIILEKRKINIFVYYVVFLILIFYLFSFIDVIFFKYSLLFFTSFFIIYIIFILYKIFLKKKLFWLFNSYLKNIYLFLFPWPLNDFLVFVYVFWI